MATSPLLVALVEPFLLLGEENQELARLSTNALNQSPVPGGIAINLP
jgi:hypothetical protein